MVEEGKEGWKGDKMARSTSRGRWRREERGGKMRWGGAGKRM